MRTFIFVLTVILFMVSLAFADTGNYDKALASYVKGDYKTAIKYLKEYVEKKPDPYAYYLLGYASYKIKRHAESVRYFKEAYIIDPNFSPIIYREK